jgi:hypothetical protein
MVTARRWFALASMMLATPLLQAQSAFGPELPISSPIALGAIGGMTTGDIDGDGLPDVVLHEYSLPRVHWMRQTAEHQFEAPRLAVTGPEVIEAMGVGDVDGDGHLDIVTGHVHDASRLLFFRGDGTGGFGPAETVFGPPVDVPETGSGASNVLLADLNGDGRDEILYHSFSSLVRWQWTAGGWTPSTIAPGYWVQDVLLFDADLDGDLDAAVQGSSPSDDVLLLMENDGSGGFGPGRVLDTLIIGAGLAGYGDLDGNGWDDLVYFHTVDEDFAELVWLANPGDAATEWTRQLVDKAHPYYSLFESFLVGCVGDFDRDGLPDIARLDHDGIRLFRNAGAGFAPPSLLPYSVSSEKGSSLRSTDIDQNGLAEWLLDTGPHGSIVVYGLGSKGIDQHDDILSKDRFSGAWSVDLTDWDGDGDLDAVGVNQADGRVSIHRQSGTGLFARPEVLVDNGSWGHTRVVLADLDNDGREDLLVLGGAASTLMAYRRMAGDSLAPGVPIGNGAEDVFVADVDADGRLDILTAGPGPGTIWYRNDGTGGFAEQPRITGNGLAPSCVATADFNGDGLVDILVGGFADTIVWMEAQPAGGFGAPRIITADGAWVQDVAATDLDTDGDQDVIYSSYTDSLVGSFLNDGTGSFHRGPVLASGWPGPNDLAVGDLDHDGDPDLVAGTVHGLVWSRNPGPSGTWTAERLGEAGLAECRSPVLGDLDGDRNPDLAYAVPNGHGYFAWRENRMGCARASALEVLSIGAGTVDLRWASVPNAVGYLIRGRRDPTERWRFQASAVPRRRIDWSFPPGAAYVWQVKAICDADTGAWSAPAIAVFPAERNRTQAWEVFPNPVLGNRLHIRGSALPGESTLRILDVSGRPMHQERFRSHTELDVMDWPAGWYLLELVSGTLRETFRIVVP